MEKIKVNKHRAIHSLFENATTIEKIRIILEMDRSVLQGDTLHDIERVLDLHDWLEYHSHCQKQKVVHPVEKILDWHGINELKEMQDTMNQTEQVTWLSKEALKELTEFKGMLKNKIDKLTK